ncbi:MAG: PilZ domain-containing protein [Pseudomonadota bacterium]
MKSWREQLPVTDLERTLAELLRALEGLNTCPLRAGVRAELITIIESVLLPFLPDVEKALRQHVLPLGRRSRERADTYAALLRALGFAHLLVAHENTEGMTRHAQRAVAPLQTALVLAGALTVHHGRLYQPSPSDHWRQLHDILQAANILGIADVPGVTGPRYGPLALDRIDHVMARILAVGATDTNALEIGEIDLLARWINRIPVVCSSYPDPGADSHAPILHARLERDEPPALLHQVPADERAGCYVDLRPMLEALRERPEELEPAPRADGRSLAERLLRQWSRPATRQHSRETTHDQQRLCLVGLNRIHDFLQAELDARHNERQRAAADARRQAREGDARRDNPPRDPNRVTVFELSDAALDSDMALIETPDQAPRDDDPHPLTSGPPDVAASAWEDVGRGLEISHQPGPSNTPITKRSPPEHWHVDDIGAGGVRLRLENPRQSLLIGDLVALRAPRARSGSWTVGVLRWIRFDSASATSIGVEYLATRCLPVQVQDYRSGRPAGSLHPGLFAPVRTDRQGAALFLPAQVFDHESRVVCWLSGRARVLMLDSERTGTTLFTEVGCQLTSLDVDTDDLSAPASDDNLSFPPGDSSA